MSLQLSIPRGPIYFVSDVHLGAKVGVPEREAWLLELLSEIPGRSGALFVLGDLFDFWFEYRHAVPKGTFRISRAMADVVDSGVPVVYLGGNHDFWLGSYLEKEIGAAVSLEPITAELHGRRVHLAHGDGLGPGDGGYKILKAVLRNPLAIAGYRALHPDLGIPLGYHVSSISRKHTTAREVLLPRIVRDIARPRVRDQVEAMVMGHVHEPVHYQWSGRDFLIIGDWIANFTHVRMVDGEFQLMRRTNAGYTRIEPQALPNPL